MLTSWQPACDAAHRGAACCAGQAVGAESEGETASARIVVGDPSYFSDRVRRTGQVVRAICVLNHPIPSTDNATSTQIIIPQKQAGPPGELHAPARCRLQACEAAPWLTQHAPSPSRVLSLSTPAVLHSWARACAARR